MDRELEVALRVDQGLGAPGVQVARQRVIAVVNDPAVLLEAADFVALGGEGCDVLGGAVFCVGAVTLAFVRVVVSGVVHLGTRTANELVRVAEAAHFGADVAGVEHAGVGVPAAPRALEDGRIAHAQFIFLDGRGRACGEPCEPVAIDVSVIGGTACEGSKQKDVHLDSGKRARTRESN